MKITAETIEQFHKFLEEDEKSAATIQKYIHEIRSLAAFLSGQPVSKHLLLAYKTQLMQDYHAMTVNVKLSAINLFLRFLGITEYKMKFLKVQRARFRDEDRELTEAEYKQLLVAARERGDFRLYYMMQTICSTGIRVSELPFITVQAVRQGYAEIRMKGKSRRIILPDALTALLRRYIREKRIESGCIFRTRSGRPVERTNILHAMKRLCSAAGVSPNKVFPHNLRHLFATCFYAVEKNLAYLADVLRHASIETTRIYVATTARTHLRTLRQMHLLA